MVVHRLPYSSCLVLSNFLALDHDNAALRAYESQSSTTLRVEMRLVYAVDTPFMMVVCRLLAILNHPVLDS
jgi:hypothetical protein